MQAMVRLASWPLNGSKAGGDLILTQFFCCVNLVVLILTSWNLNSKSSEVCIKVRLPQALSAFMARDPFHKGPETFLLPESNSKIHIFSMSTEVSFIREVTGVYSSLFLDTNELKMALRTRIVSGAFEKRTPGNYAHNCKVA